MCVCETLNGCDPSEPANVDEVHDLQTAQNFKRKAGPGPEDRPSEYLQRTD